jgi:hypothetical protein
VGKLAARSSATEDRPDDELESLSTSGVTKVLCQQQQQSMTKADQSYFLSKLAHVAVEFQKG